MRGIAILGATSQIALDLVLRLSQVRDDIFLYARNTERLLEWMSRNRVHFPVFGYSEYGQEPHDAVLNFVGVGDPQKALEMGAAILTVTREFDELLLVELKKHQNRRYLFMSSGAAYGGAFSSPANDDIGSAFPAIGNSSNSYYAVAKFYAEVLHRSLSGLPIVDLRIFNYFSRSQDINARYFITDAARSILTNTVLTTSQTRMFRDYLHPDDFFQIITRVLDFDPINTSLDLYSRAPVDKADMLAMMEQKFGLRYVVGEDNSPIATGIKPYYYSISRRADILHYKPEYSSLDGVSMEMEALVSTAMNSGGSFARRWQS